VKKEDRNRRENCLEGEISISRAKSKAGRINVLKSWRKEGGEKRRTVEEEERRKE